MPNPLTPLSNAFVKFVDISADKSSQSATNEEKSIKSEMLRAYLTHHLMTKGPCPCPDMLAKDKSLCGRRSAWSRIPNKGVLCYPEDIDNKMIKEWKKKQEAAVAANLFNRSLSRKAQEVRDKVSTYMSKLGITTERGTQTDNFTQPDSQAPSNNRQMTQTDIHAPSTSRQVTKTENKPDLIPKEEPVTQNEE